MAFNDFMHERNIYKEKPDFRQIALDYPELRKYAVPNEKGKVYIDFNNLEALRVVTKVLLKKDFNVSIEIPSGFLIPTVPQRLNYILWIEDLLEAFPKENSVLGIDIGTGPCAIFSLLGAQKNGWKFISTDTSDEVITIAKRNVATNNLDNLISVIKVSKESILKEVLSSRDNNFSFCLCNPPFFDTTENIRRKHPHVKLTLPSVTQESEIKSEGGEVVFVRRMIEESLLFKDKIKVYSSMFGKKKSYLQILKELEDMKDITVAKTEFCQGNTVRWGLAWTFKKEIKFKQQVKPKPPKPLKAKPPLKLHVPFMEKESNVVKKLLKKIKFILQELEIQFKIQKSNEKFVEMEVTAEKNTWSHQRRKRRKHMQDHLKVDEKNEETAKITQNSSEPERDISSESTNIEDITVTNQHEASSNTNLKKRKAEEEEDLKESKKAKSNTQENDAEKKTIGTNDVSDDCFKESIVKPMESCSQTTCTTQKRKAEEEDDLKESKKAKSNTHEDDAEEKTIGTNNDVSDESFKESIVKPMASGSQTTNEGSQNNLFLCCCLRLIKCKNHIIVEMNCPPDVNRETMHQVFQFLKNKLTI